MSPATRSPSPLMLATSPATPTPSRSSTRRTPATPTTAFSSLSRGLGLLRPARVLAALALLLPRSRPLARVRLRPVLAPLTRRPRRPRPTRPRPLLAPLGLVPPRARSLPAPVSLSNQCVTHHSADPFASSVPSSTSPADDEETVPDSGSPSNMSPLALIFVTAAAMLYFN